MTATVATCEHTIHHHHAAAAWQRRRSELVHDWLRNRFLPRVHACVAAGSPGAQVSPKLLDSLRATVHEWPARSADIRILADECRDAMSPAQFVDAIAPSLDHATTEFVRSTAVDLWALRRAIDPLIATVHAACDAADAAYAAWVNEPSSDPALRGLAHHGERVAAALGRFPARTSL